MQKYRLIAEALVSTGIIKKSWIREPKAAHDKDILLCHTKEWFDKIKNNTLEIEDELRLELKMSPEFAMACILCCGATTQACQQALENSVGIHIGGGFHHAFPDHGEGFCALNDMAIAIMAMQKKGGIKKAAVIDLDLHQGNGTAYIFRNDPDVFTFSMHQQNNYPAIKPRSDLDIGLEDGTEDEQYLEILEKALKQVLNKHKPQMIVYQAGSDPYKEDVLGGLNLSMEGLKKRDEIVFFEAQKRHIPCAVTLGGGYSKNLADGIKIHINTISAALKSANQQTSSRK
ncbi:histone deacetylase [Elusimicrobiota bacterium]